ncbi:hypothetical protein BVX95_02340 [archaeon D22]|nr:hypothetical protein BVX95_02340 [archaeon D22]
MGGIAPTYSVGWKKNSSMGIFLAGCDYNCHKCHNAEIKEFKEEFLMNILDVKREITSNINDIDSIFFTGAEPCLQRQALLSIARHAKTAGLKIGLKTNGAKPETIKSMLIHDLLDFVELNIYSDFNPGNFEKITRSQNFFNPTDAILKNIYESLTLIKKYNPKLEIAIKTVVKKGINDDNDILLSLASKIQDLDAVWVLEREKEIAEDGEEIEDLQMKEFLEEVKILAEDKFPYLNIEII